MSQQPIKYSVSIKIFDTNVHVNILETTYKELLEFNSDEHATGLDSLYFQNTNCI